MNHRPFDWALFRRLYTPALIGLLFGTTVSWLNLYPKLPPWFWPGAAGSAVGVAGVILATMWAMQRRPRYSPDTAVEGKFVTRQIPRAEVEANKKPGRENLYCFIEADFSEPTAVYGCFHEERLVGVGAIVLQGGVWTLRSCVVDPSFRGYGLQRKLIHLRLAHARAQGAKFVEAWVMPHNSTSICNLVCCDFQRMPVTRLFHGLDHRGYRYTFPTV